MSIEQKHIDRFSGPLKHILEREVAAGNEISETFCSGFSEAAGTVFVLLKRPFVTSVQRNLDGIVFRKLNDPHYWKAEYEDKARGLLLACGF